MIQRVLLNHAHKGLTCLGLVIFMVVFAGALVWVWRKSSNHVYAELAQLPLEEN